MPTATFRFGENLTHECSLVFGNFGNESYFVDGALVHKHWSLSPSGAREFSACGNHIKIDVSVNLRRVECKAFVDGVLVADDLFSELNAKFIRVRNNRPPFYLQVIVWFVIAFVILTVLNQLKTVT